MPRNKPTLEVSRPHFGHVMSIVWKNGEQLVPDRGDPLDSAHCAKCEEKLAENIKIITRYNYTYFENNQGGGEVYFMEIYCTKCKKYTVWNHDYAYW